MTRVRKLPVSYWLMLSALVLAGVLYTADLLLGWGLKGIGLILGLLTMGAGVYVLRMMWKQADAATPEARGDDDTLSRR
ncbi:hypothetical protein OH146_11865 [Salinibacterium sp. SYSU T00001]|uniref:hypothetical protein n=1 Tax=Homoserinimonas sedimenticola TaxID=2986805 RepID=UPI00223667DB|nr:hypothetical protein [Salinibacterium sedimenticola]MCW4386469.1 hypothetical protein [Salinibacterium sedimenticola]